MELPRITRGSDSQIKVKVGAKKKVIHMKKRGQNLDKPRWTKAYDSMPHTWIQECLVLYKTVAQIAMKCRKDHVMHCPHCCSA